jgi:hypothetical protein
MSNRWRNHDKRISLKEKGLKKKNQNSKTGLKTGLDNPGSGP